ncbi:MAG: hypothetical protein PHU98_03510 [Mariniphaga sp.]|nr:hypothetical protein [Mariniphaga sp.]
MKNWNKINVYGLFVFLALSCGQPGNKSKELGYSQDFESANAIGDFSFVEPDLWQIVTDSSGNSYLDAKDRGSYQPPFRSPFLIALIDSVIVSDFVLEADLMQKQVAHDCQGENCIFCMHRDMCVFWAFRDSSHYYYAHIARRGDDVAHQVHIVNDAPRTPVTVRRNEGVDWGVNVWKHVKVVRSVKDTLLQVFFEDMQTPVLEARDNTFTSGRIGFGSFDEAGSIDNIMLYTGEVKE